ncbi:MAG: chemotaxis protein CheW [Spirochaetales bacterium]|nr:chemotaxis protein CheW [Spirochaetales bacterium]
MAEDTTTLQMVTFQLGEEHYGINIMEVNEIVRIQEVRAIPNAPSYIEGIINLRGKIIPVINLHKRFHLKRAVLSEEDEMLGGFIIIDLDGMQIGVVIDKISRVVSIKSDSIQPPPQMISGIGAEYIQGVTSDESGYLIILDTRRLFDPKELQQISNIGK